MAGERSHVEFLACRGPAEFHTQELDNCLVKLGTIPQLKAILTNQSKQLQGNLSLMIV